jgi:hypothetical protein
MVKSQRGDQDLFVGLDLDALERDVGDRGRQRVVQTLIPDPDGD